jgi:hypothetical protein
VANRAEQYRHLAQECQRIAKSLPTGSSSRKSLLEMAEVWERLAKEQERAPGVTATAADPAQASEKAIGRLSWRASSFVRPCMRRW